MNNYEEQRNKITERNEKNKAWRKRLKIFYIGLFAPWVVLVVLALVLKSVELPIDGKALLAIMVATSVAWALWVILGIFITRCPHCGGFLNRVPNNAKHCPHCTTILKVYPDFEDTEL